MTNNALNGTGHIIYDTSGNPVLEQTGYTYMRIYGPGTDELLGERLDLGSRYYTHDALGSVTSASDPDGLVRYRRTYRPFGQMSGTADSNQYLNTRFGYTGREISVGSTMQYRSRQYDSSYGRFLQQDDFKGWLLSPPSLHRYVYAFNNPVNYTDPSGNLGVAGILGWAAVILGLIGAVLLEEAGSIIGLVLMLVGLVLVLVEWIHATHSLHRARESRRILTMYGLLHQLGALPPDFHHGQLSDVTIEELDAIAEHMGGKKDDLRTMMEIDPTITIDALREPGQLTDEDLRALGLIR
jgi:RHS repeat-associated protein